MIINQVITGGGGSATSTIIVTAPTGSTVTLTNPRGTTTTGTEVSGTWTFSGLAIFGNYTVTASRGSDSKTQTVLVDIIGTFSVEIYYGRLPLAYQEVEYIESTGTQYIDSGVLATTTTTTEVTFTIPTGFVYGNAQFLFGAFVVNNTMYSVAFPSATLMRIPNNQNNFVNVSIPNISSGQHTVSYKYGNIKVDGTQVSTNTYKAMDSINVYLFARSGEMACGSYKVHEATITLNGTEQRHFIPCYRVSDNVVGMYDMTNNVFYDNDGTGVFIAGNPV